MGQTSEITSDTNQCEARIYKDRRSNGTERKGERDIAACDRLAMISDYGL